jgi:hypothetical protein
MFNNDVSRDPPGDLRSPDPRMYNNVSRDPPAPPWDRYSVHPLVLALKHEQQPTAEQLQSAQLFAVLVSNDVEHRIILPSTLRTIQKQWQLAYLFHNPMAMP